MVRPAADTGRERRAVQFCYICRSLGRTGQQPLGVTPQKQEGEGHRSGVGTHLYCGCQGSNGGDRLSRLRIG